jgi:hypothetical protein
MNAMLALNLQRNLNQHNNGQCTKQAASSHREPRFRCVANCRPSSTPVALLLVSMIDLSPQTDFDHLVSAELGKMPLKFMLLKGSAPRRRGSRLYIELEWPVKGPFSEKAEDAGQMKKRQQRQISEGRRDLYVVEDHFKPSISSTSAGDKRCKFPEPTASSRLWSKSCSLLFLHPDPSIYAPKTNTTPRYISNPHVHMPVIYPHAVISLMLRRPCLADVECPWAN